MRKKEEEEDEKQEEEDKKEEKKEEKEKDKEDEKELEKDKEKQQEEPETKDDDESRALDKSDSNSDAENSTDDQGTAEVDSKTDDAKKASRALDAKNKKDQASKDKKAEDEDASNEKEIEKEKKTQPEEPDRELDEVGKPTSENSDSDSDDSDAEENSNSKQSEKSRQAELRDLKSNSLDNRDTITRNLNSKKARIERLSEKQSETQDSDADKRFMKLDRWAELEEETEAEENNSLRRRLAQSAQDTVPQVEEQSLRRLTPIKYLDAGDYSSLKHRRLNNMPKEIQAEDKENSGDDKEERGLIEDFKSNHRFGVSEDGDSLTRALDKDRENKEVTVPLINDFKTESDYRRLLIKKTHANSDEGSKSDDGKNDKDDELKPAEGGEARRLNRKKHLNRILTTSKVFRKINSAKRLHEDIIQVARFERRLTKKINMLVKRSKDANRAYRKLQEMKHTPVKFSVKKDLTESLSSVLDKPKGIKETKVTRNSVESRNPVQRLKRLIPNSDAIAKRGHLMRFINLGLVTIALLLLF